MIILHEVVSDACAFRSAVGSLNWDEITRRISRVVAADGTVTPQA